jgi:hypothetical protein
MDGVFLTTFLEVVAWLFIAAFWLLALIVFAWIFIDIFRRRDLTGWGKAGWTLLVFVLPIIGGIIYVSSRPKYLTIEVDTPWAPDENMRMSPAEEVAYAHGLMEQGKITQAEFEDIKLNLGL